MNTTANLAEHMAGSKPTFASTEHEHRPGGLTMEALCWHGKKSVGVEGVPVPTITDTKDVIIRVTGTTICGSDLHLYHMEYVSVGEQGGGRPLMA